MRKIGDNSYAFYLEIKDKHKRDWYRAVKGIINLRKTYSDEIIDLACKRALHFGIYSYSRIKKILENNSKADNSYHKKLKQIIDYDLLILDELGFKQLPKYSTDDFFNVISKRYETKSTIITTNKIV